MGEKFFEICKKCGEPLSLDEGYQDNDGSWECHQCHKNITCFDKGVNQDTTVRKSCSFPCLGKGVD